MWSTAVFAGRVEYRLPTFSDMLAPDRIWRRVYAWSYRSVFSRRPVQVLSGAVSGFFSGHRPLDEETLLHLTTVLTVPLKPSAYRTNANGYARISEKPVYHTANRISNRDNVVSAAHVRRGLSERTCVSAPRPGCVPLMRFAGVARAANVPPWERNFESFTPVVSSVYFLSPPPHPFGRTVMFVANFG